MLSIGYTAPRVLVLRHHVLVVCANISQCCAREILLLRLSARYCKGGNPQIFIPTFKIYPSPLLVCKLALRIWYSHLLDIRNSLFSLHVLPYGRFGFRRDFEQQQLLKWRIPRPMLHNVSSKVFIRISSWMRHVPELGLNCW